MLSKPKFIHKLTAMAILGLSVIVGLSMYVASWWDHLSHASVSVKTVPPSAEFHSSQAIGSARTAETPGREVLIIGFDGKISDKGDPDPWKRMVHCGTPDIRIEKPQDRHEEIAQFVCKDSSFSLNRLVDLDARKFHIVSWDWEVTKFPEFVPRDRKGDADEVLQVLLVFDGRRVLKYTWVQEEPSESMRDESFLLFKVKSVAVATGRDGLGRWRRVSRDFVKDFQRAYGETPSKVMAIRVQSNSEYSHTTGSGSFGKLTFE